jgi:hypothetical protein
VEQFGVAFGATTFKVGFTILVGEKSVVADSLELKARRAGGIGV